MTALSQASRSPARRDGVKRFIISKKESLIELRPSTSRTAYHQTNCGLHRIYSHSTGPTPGKQRSRPCGIHSERHRSNGREAPRGILLADNGGRVTACFISEVHPHGCG